MPTALFTTAAHSAALSTVAQRPVPFYRSAARRRLVEAAIVVARVAFHLVDVLFNALRAAKPTAKELEAFAPEQSGVDYLLLAEHLRVHDLVRDHFTILRCPDLRQQEFRCFAK